MSYSHFTIEERISIKHLLAKGVSIRQIASELGRSPSSVSREIRRNSHEPNRYIVFKKQKDSIKIEFQEIITSFNFLVERKSRFCHFSDFVSKDFFNLSVKPSFVSALLFKDKCKQQY